MEAMRELFRQVGNLFRWWYVVAPWEQSVRVRLGKHVEVLGAGVHVRIPLVDRVFLQSTRRRFLNIATQTVTTVDGRAVTISGALGYEIVDIGRLYDSLHDAEDTLDSSATGLIARYVMARALADVRPGEIERHVVECLDMGRYGLNGVDFYVTDFVAVRTYRIMQGNPKDYRITGAALDTFTPHGAP